MKKIKRVLATTLSLLLLIGTIPIQTYANNDNTPNESMVIESVLPPIETPTEEKTSEELTPSDMESTSSEETTSQETTSSEDESKPPEETITSQEAKEETASSETESKADEKTTSDEADPLAGWIAPRALSSIESGIGSYQVASGDSISFRVGQAVNYPIHQTNFFYATKGSNKSLAYCIEPSKPNPSNGSYTAKPISAAYNATQKARALKLMYYFPGGDGYSTSNSALQWVTNKLNSYNAVPSSGMSDDMIYFSFAHLTLGYVLGNPLSSKVNQYWVKSVQEFVDGGTLDSLATPSGYDVTLLNYGTTASQAVGFLSKSQFGQIKLKKTSAQPEITTGSDSYSLAGAEYTIYTDRACTQAVTTITTDTNGYAQTSPTLALATYYVKETKAPKGYALDYKVHTVTISDDGTSPVIRTLNVQDLPKLDPVGVLVRKVDSKTSQNTPSVNTATLEGAEFTFKFYTGNYSGDPATQGKSPERTWVFKTNKNGFAQYDSSFKVSGDELYLSPSGIAMLPIGTITVQETKSPEGYLLNDNIYVVQIKDDGSADNILHYVAPEIPEQLLSLNLLKLVDDTGLPLTDVTFEHTRPDGTKTEYTTDANGKTAIEGLQYGIHEVEETSAPTGVMLNDGVVKFEVKKDNTIVLLENTGTVENGEITFTVDADGNPNMTVKDKLQRGDFKLVKRSEDNHVAGLSFRIYGTSDTGVAIDETLTTDKNGQIDHTNMLVGTYDVEEVLPPDRYTPPQKQTIRIEWNKTAVAVFDNNLARGDFKLKKSAEDGKVDGFRFRLYGTSVKGDEVDLIVTTDENGDIDVAGVLIGTYTVEEIDVPDQYVAPTKQTVKIEDGKTSTVKFKNVLARGDFKLIKTSENGKVDSLKFRIYGTSTSGHPVDETGTTDSNGALTFANLLVGKYSVDEIDTPVHFVQPKTQTVTIELGKTATVEFDNRLVRGTVEVKKTDAEFPDITLEGAEFKVFMDKNENGKYDMNYDRELTSLQSQEKGLYHASNLIHGKYLLKETKAPEGFLLDENYYPFEIVTDGATVRVETTPDKGFENYPMKSDVELTKRDVSTGEALPNAGYRIYDKDKNLIEEKYTDENGVAVYEKLRYGDYFYQEFDAPYGYHIDEELYPFSIKEDGEIIKCTATDSAKIGYVKYQSPKEKAYSKLFPHTGDNADLAFLILCSSGTLLCLVLLGLKPLIAKRRMKKFLKGKLTK